MRIHPVLILAFAMAPSLAMASPQMDPNSPRAQKVMQVLEQKFAAADANHDGKLTLTEAQAGMPRLAEHFNDIDVSHQGYVTLDQIKSYVISHSNG